jgi:hypothetical protein
MKVVKVSDKVFIGKDILHAAVFQKNDERTTYNMMYVESSNVISFAKKFNVSTLDSTITYNFLKIIPIRLLFGLKRIAYFFLIMLFNRPDVAIIFFANGLSAIEKGIMARISILFQIPVMVFPRAGGLIVDYKKNLEAFC